MEETAKAGMKVTALLDLFAASLTGDYLFSDRPGVADFYLFVMLLWAERFGVITPVRLEGLRDRMRARPAVRAAMVYEGLLPGETATR